MSSSGWTLIQYDWCPYKKGGLGHRHIEDDHYKDTGERSFRSQGKRLQEKPTLLAPQYWESRLENSEKIIACHLIHSMHTKL